MRHQLATNATRSLIGIGKGEPCNWCGCAETHAAAKTAKKQGRGARQSTKASATVLNGYEVSSISKYVVTKY